MDDIDEDRPTNVIEEVPESIIRQSAEILKDVDDNVFKRLIGYADMFREAGMTPVYLYYKTRNVLHVVAAETFGKRLH